MYWYSICLMNDVYQKPSKRSFFRSIRSLEYRFSPQTETLEVSSTKKEDKTVCVWFKRDFMHQLVAKTMQQSSFRTSWVSVMYTEQYYYGVLKYSGVDFYLAGDLQ